MPPQSPTPCRPVRRPFPPHLPRERDVVEAPTRRNCCGSNRIVKLGEGVTETGSNSVSVEGGQHGLESSPAEHATCHQPFPRRPARLGGSATAKGSVLARDQLYVIFDERGLFYESVVL